MNFTWGLRLFSHYTGKLFVSTRKAVGFIKYINSNGTELERSHTHRSGWPRGFVNYIPVFTSHPLNVYFRLSRFQSSLLHFYSRKGSLHKVCHDVAHDLSDMLRSILTFGAAQPRSVTVSGNEMCEQRPYPVQCEHGLSDSESPCLKHCL